SGACGAGRGDRSRRGAREGERGRVQRGDDPTGGAHASYRSSEVIPSRWPNGRCSRYRRTERWSFKFEKQVKADVASVLRLVARLDITGQPGLSVAEGTRLLRKIASYPNYGVYVAEAPAGTIVGTFALLVMDNLAHRGAPSAIVEDGCVDDSARGQ